MVLERPGTFHAIPGRPSCHLTLSDSLHNFSSLWHLEASTILKKISPGHLQFSDQPPMPSTAILRAALLSWSSNPCFSTCLQQHLLGMGLSLALTISSPRSQHSVQFSLVSQLCPTLCNPMDYSMPGLPVHHQLLESTQTHVHWISDAIQPSHPLLSPSPSAFNPSQHQGLSQWVSSSHQVAKVLEFQLKHQSCQWTFRTNFL